MCNPLSIATGLFTPKDIKNTLGSIMPKPGAAASGDQAQNTASATNAVADLRKRNRSLLSAAGAVGDQSAAITSAGGAIGKTALGA